MTEMTPIEYARSKMEVFQIIRRAYSEGKKPKTIVKVIQEQLPELEPDVLNKILVEFAYDKE